MENLEVNKTSDEIINELFSSLNVPLSPKLVELEERIIIKGEQVSTHTGDSDNSEDDESDSKSSESDEEAKTTMEELQPNRTEKVEKKSVKKKKDKRKKKKKHRKKEDGGRHKHKKKKRKENFETAEEAKLAGDILQDVKLKNQAVIQKIMIREATPQEAMESKNEETNQLGSKSPTLLHTLVEVDDVCNKEDLQESPSQFKEENPAPHRVVTKSAWQEVIILPPQINSDSLKNKSDVPSSMSVESASKTDIQSCPTDKSSPEAESVSNSTQTTTTATASEQKRKRSPHSCSPSPGKKLKSSNSISPSKSTSPKVVSRHRSPTCTERSRSRSAKDSKCRTTSRSPAVKRSKSRSKRSRSRSRKRSSSRRRSTSKSRKKTDSKSRRKSRSRSRRRSRSRKRSRSRSRSRRRARSRSKKRSRSRSRKGSKSRKRSRSKSRKRSRSKSRKRSRSRSRKRSGSKSKRKSVSKSKRSKSRDRSRSRSRSVKRSQSRIRRSRSKSSKRSTSKPRRSRSRRKSGSQSRRRSRSRSSPKSSPAKERFDMFAIMRERVNRLAELKSQCIPDGSLGSLLLSAAVSVQSGGCVGVPNVPQPLPASDPSSIPLPEKEVVINESPTKDNGIEEMCVDAEDDKTAPVIEDSLVVSSAQEQDSTRAKDGNRTRQEEGSEKGKMKTIITIKSLKDSIVFHQAQEEAERKAKEKVDQPPPDSENRTTPAPERQNNQERKDKQQQDEPRQDEEKKKENTTKNTREESEDNSRKNKKEEEKEKRYEKEERKESEERQNDSSPIKKKNVDTQVDFMKNRIEKGSREVKKNIIEVDLEETDIDTNTASRKNIINQEEEREDNKENKHSSKQEKEERKKNSQSSKVKKDEEEKENDLSSESENEDKRNKKYNKTEEKEDKKTKSSKIDKEEESKKNDEIIIEKEEVNSLSSKREEEEGNKQSNKAEEEEEEEEEEEGEWSQESKEIEEDKSKGEEVEEGKKCIHLSMTEDHEDSKGTKDESGKNGHQQPEEDLTDRAEEGEIFSDKEEEEEEEVVIKPTKTRTKKAKKDKSGGKEKKRSHKDKNKNKELKKKVHDKKKDQDKTKSRSKDTHKSRQHSSSGSKEHSHSRRHRKHSSRSRSRSRDHSSRQHRRSHSRSRSKSRSKRRRESTSDLRDKVTRKRLLEIARRNAVYLMQNGCLPPSVEKEQLVKIKAGGKSVDELTDFCKQLVASGNYSDVDVSDPSISSEEENNSEKPFSSARHPFSVRDSKPILMNIRNAPMLPTKTNAERLAGQAKLREQFPVSSGSQHRTKESEWVPVTPKEKKEEDKVFTKPEAPSVDISQIVSTRLSAMRKLQDNPNDSEAIKTLNNVQKEMQNWALSKQEPGQFTGTTGVKVLSQEELSSGHQAWARKEQFKEAAPVRPQFGLKMLQKMGWSPGEGLGKNKEGTTEPLLLDVKMDKKGFHAQEEVTPKKQPIPLVKDLSGGQQCKHPVSALVELCSKRKWSPPDFEMVFDCGPDHKKNFLMKVMVNGQEFKPSVAASTKKMAKANAAAAYLQSLGLYPKDARYPL